LAEAEVMKTANHQRQTDKAAALKNRYANERN